ncbi:PREDICTED: uncharacterized protein LOC104597390 [Nelumbo nucifera]|uniref:Uncharacterized protein LOC104597390 n=2 Tax=Nelumbo nucifera TaxID=4432 RepID=A0A1U8A6Y0_NELNU|nr:PREDICTED: uncharacterized protein LOC104597390 [Nelumbo nucifera]XP_010257187.1 PREDICTED: uncharacterized protein LOC104597390 [Nelumbo nucifera]DAD42385.1 TPA_asm: hypothetical protein HUJ06_000615 [Nelumbo nucifera]
MAFHVACPITRRKICFCTLGFPRKLQSEKGRKDFLEEVFRVEEFLRDPWSLRAREKDTVQVLVPRIVVPTPAVTPVTDGFGGGDEGEENLSAQSKRAAMHKRAVAASLAAEDYARRFETGDLADASTEKVWDIIGENQNSSTVKVMCRLCFQGENEGSDRAMRMLPCKICNKKYHRNCLKNWAQHRDLFHWSSWICPSCRICEVCRRAGDPTKFMFCKRCDSAYHCYCQQPPHKNVSVGPFLCPKHTRCHSCRSNVSGSGPSTRWFLGYTFCDACGRLFLKGNYCPVCLKVFRDTEQIPMVCCDDCSKWVHPQCDGISDEKYLQYQTDTNLYYRCAACRGDCYKVSKPEEAISELWRRRDEADREEIASLRAAAGLPTQEEIFSISPFSDDEENGPIILNGRSLRFSVKGMVDKAPKNTKEYGKKNSNRKYIKKKGYYTLKTEAHQSFDRPLDEQSLENSLYDERNDHLRSYISEGAESFLSPSAGIPVNTKERCSINKSRIVKHNLVEDIVVTNEDRTSKVVKIKSSEPHGLGIGEGIGKRVCKSETTKGKKLVIHLGVRNRNVTTSPRSEASSCQREQELTASNGSDETSQQKANGKKYVVDGHDGLTRLGDSKGDKPRVREDSLIKLGKSKSDVSDLNSNISGGSIREGYQSTYQERSAAAVEPVGETTTLKDEDILLRKHSRGTPNIHSESCNNSSLTPSVSDAVPKDPKPLLKLKFKNPYIDNRSSWVPHGEEEKTSVKGQRSKRKRPSPLTEKALVREDDENTQYHQENPVNEVMGANWILKKLGKDAIGKRVEVHQPSDNSWRKGVVTEVMEGTSSLTVHLDDGKAKTLDLGKQGVRFVSQKQKRTKT